MWKAETFATLEALLAGLNQRAMEPAACKIVVADDEHGAQHFHLLYVENGRPLVGVAVAEAEVNGLEGSAPEEAVDEAEAIIADAQNDD